MREIGRRLPAIAAQPSADGLRQAAVHMATSLALAGIASTGIPKGIYRFKTHEEADSQVIEGLARVVADGASRRARGA
jgi:hypothetical protein